MLIAKIDRLADARLSNGMNKSELAKASGVSHSIIVRIECGAGTSPKTAKAISDALGYSVNDLFEFQK